MDGKEMMEAPDQRAMMEDPFANVPVDASGVPALPMAGQGGFADVLLDDSAVPKKIRDDNYEVFARDNVLSFQNKETKRDKLLNFDIIQIDGLCSMPYHDYTFKKDKSMEKLRHIFETKIDRAVGTREKDAKNERTTLQSQFTEMRQISEVGSSQNNIHGNFMKRVLSRKQ